MLTLDGISMKHYVLQPKPARTTRYVQEHTFDFYSLEGFVHTKFNLKLFVHSVSFKFKPYGGGGVGIYSHQWFIDELLTYVGLGSEVAAVDMGPLWALVN